MRVEISPEFDPGNGPASIAMITKDYGLRQVWARRRGGDRAASRPRRPTGVGPT